jgi:hypothetical protein
MKFFITIIVVFFSIRQSECQVAQPAKYQDQVSFKDTLAINAYKRLMNHSYDLINGREYIPYHSPHQSDPFFKSQTVCSGTVYSNGRSYNNFKILYDIYKDELVINYLNFEGRLKLISLNKHSIDSFEIKVDDITTRFKFISFAPDSHMKNSFYEVPYSGETRLLISHTKSYSQLDGKDVYTYNIYRYLYFNGSYFHITTLSKFCKLFGDKKSILRKYIMSFHIPSFRKISDSDLIQILRYYETI